MFVVLFTGLVIYSIDIKILLIICAAFTICVCMYQGHTWKDIEDEIVAKLAKAFPAIMILICVGLMIGALTVCGNMELILERIMKHIHGIGQLITLTVALGVVMITVIGEPLLTFL